MRTLILSAGLLAAALIGGPQAAIAQNAPLAGGGEYLPPPSSAPNTITTGRNPVRPLPPSGGGEYLPPPSPVPDTATTGQGPVRPLPPPDGGEYLPPPSR